MQMQTGQVPPLGAKVPPTPQIQTPIGGSHSRSSSHASVSSQQSKVESDSKLSKESLDKVETKTEVLKTDDAKTEKS